MQKSTVALIFMVCLGLVYIPECSAARRGGITQTTFFATDGGNYSGATSSSFTAPDGTIKGECSYTNSDGNPIIIKYEETRDGRVTARSETKGITNPDAELKKCQAQVKELERDLTENLRKNEEALKTNLAHMENNFREQMDLFNKQQETFAEQHRQFLQQMSNFHKRMEEQSRRLQQTFARQNPGRAFDPFAFTFF